MAAIPPEYDKQWNSINHFLTGYLRICHCQRKLKSIVTILLSIKGKLKDLNWNGLTPEELLICNLLDNVENIFTHGTNCEYPLLGNSGIWEYIETIKDSPALLDN